MIVTELDPTFRQTELLLQHAGSCGVALAKRSPGVHPGDARLAELLGR